MSQDEIDKKSGKAYVAVQIQLALLSKKSYPDQKFLEEIVDIIAEEFDFLSVDIRLLDAAKETAIYRAGTAREKRLARRVGDNSLVGKALALGKVLMTELEQNPFQPTAYSQVAIPIKLQDGLIGAFEISSSRELDPSVVSSLESVTQDVATILRNSKIISAG